MTTDMDKLLEIAFDQLAKEEYEKRLVEIPEHRFSLRFYWKMYPLFQRVGIGKKNHKMGDSPMELFRPIRSRRRMAAIALLILMLIGGTVVAAEPIIHWMQNFYVEQNEDHVKVQNNIVHGTLKYGRENFRKYHLKKIPEGYILNYEEFDEDFQRYEVGYRNTEDSILTLKQTWQEDDMAENLTSDTEAIENVEVNGFSGYYTEDNGIGSLMLSNGVYKLVLEGKFSEKELLELAGSLELSD